MARQPRDWLLNREHFGARRPLKGSAWREAKKASVSEQVGLLAAQRQHRIVRNVLIKRQEQDLTVKGLHALEPELGLDWLEKVLRGEAHMTIRHLVDLERLLGDVSSGTYDAAGDEDD